MIRKTLYLILAFLVLVSVGCGNRTKKDINSVSQTGNTGRAIISFSEVEHKFGQVKEGEKVGCIFSFINSGDTDLIINSVTTTCGCTVPKYDRKPIPPGGNGSLEVVFNTEGKNGTQTKTITVRSNAEPSVIILRITAEVINNSNN